MSADHEAITLEVEIATTEKRLADALEALAGFVVVAALNGAKTTDEQLLWASIILRGKKETAGEMLSRVMLGNPAAL